jgi:hypothetical protein
LEPRKPPLNNSESEATLRAALLDRQMLRRFPATEFSSDDHPRLFPFVEFFSPIDGCRVDIIWIDQHGFLSLMGIVADRTLRAQQETITQLTRCLDEMWKLPHESLFYALTLEAEGDWEESDRKEWGNENLEQAMAGYFGPWFIPTLWELIEESLREKRVRLILATSHLAKGIPNRVLKLRKEKNHNLYALEMGALDDSTSPWKMIGSAVDLKVEHAKNSEWSHYVLQNGSPTTQTELPQGVRIVLISPPGGSAEPVKAIFNPRSTPEESSTSFPGDRSGNPVSDEFRDRKPFA